jgi:gas vesicle protein
MFFLLPLIGAAVGAVAGAVATHAAGEKDRQKANHEREVANRLHNDYAKLQKKYHELEDESKQKIQDTKSNSQTRIDKLVQRQAEDEAEKSLLRLALRLQQSLYDLMHDIDRKPSNDSLKAFEAAVAATNRVLLELKEETIQIPNQYLERNLKRDGYSNADPLLEVENRDRVLTNLADSNQRNEKVVVISRSHRRSSDFMDWSD